MEREFPKSMEGCLLPAGATTHSWVVQSHSSSKLMEMAPTRLSGIQCQAQALARLLLPLPHPSSLTCAVLSLPYSSAQGTFLFPRPLSILISHFGNPSNLSVLPASLRSAFSGDLHPARQVPHGCLLWSPCSDFLGYVSLAFLGCQLS